MYARYVVCKYAASFLPVHSVRMKEVQRRPMQKLTLNLGNGLEIGTALYVMFAWLSRVFKIFFFRYCPVREAKKPSFAQLDQRTNDELRTQTKYLCEVLFLQHCIVYVHHNISIGHRS